MYTTTIKFKNGAVKKETSFDEKFAVGRAEIFASKPEVDEVEVRDKNYHLIYF